MEITFRFLISTNFQTFTNINKTSLLRTYPYYETRRNTLCSEAWCRSGDMSLHKRLMYSSNYLVNLISFMDFSWPFPVWVLFLSKLISLWPPCWSVSLLLKAPWVFCRKLSLVLLKSSPRGNPVNKQTEPSPPPSTHSGDETGTYPVSGMSKAHSRSEVPELSLFITLLAPW